MKLFTAKKIVIASILFVISLVAVSIYFTKSRVNDIVPHVDQDPISLSVAHVAAKADFREKISSATIEATNIPTDKILDRAKSDGIENSDFRLLFIVKFRIGDNDLKDLVQQASKFNDPAGEYARKSLPQL